MEGRTRPEGGTGGAAADRSLRRPNLKPEVGQTDALMRSLPERYFLNLGRFVEKKNLSTLVEAYARFARASGERTRAETGNLRLEGSETADGVDAAATKGRRGIAALVLVGEGPLRGDLERQARELGLVVRDGAADPNPSGGAEVVFYPFQQADVTPLFFARCDAFILPSTREEWGLVVNEAMACGAPVIVSNRVGAHFDLVKEGVNGFSFDPDSAGALAELLGRFEIDQDLRGRLGSAGRHIIEDWQPSRFGEGGVAAMKAAFARNEGKHDVRRFRHSCHQVDRARGVRRGDCSNQASAGSGRLGNASRGVGDEYAGRSCRLLGGQRPGAIAGSHVPAIAAIVSRRQL